jgi:hypothetical protein
MTGMTPFEPGEQWSNVLGLAPSVFTCAYCGERVPSSQSYSTTSNVPHIIRICSHCKAPAFFDPAGQRYPGTIAGSNVKGVPESLAALYNEARNTAGSAPTASVLVCRKM